MSEFSEVMRQWKRMCDAISPYDVWQCPLKKAYDLHCADCYDYALSDCEKTESIVMQWAAEHPEPTTVYEWLVSLGLLSADMWSISDLHKPIPADIAKKLRNEPKEGNE